MLNTIGNILNWLAAGALFPLLLLPLASLLNAIIFNKHTQIQLSLSWFFLTIVITLIGSCFLFLLPDKSYSILPPMFGRWISGVTALVVALHLMGGPTLWLKRIAKIAERITTFAGRSVMWLILVMALTQFCVVILRYIFGINFIWMQESITYMHGGVFLLAAGYALLTDDHVRVDIFYREASPRRKAIINMFGTYLLLMPVCFLLLWAASPYVFASWQATEGSNEASGVQLLYLLKSLIPAFAVLMLLAGYKIANDCADTLIVSHKNSYQEEGI